ncbi:MAG: hydroxyquinol 1,2-dioxygenase [Deltaproteobacteria bacterium]|nr:hydroxyquinol 1,2-dioxygenase [Deltaproteobacteria bacterium]
MSDAKADGANDYGYRRFTLSKFNFERDEYFAHITWPGGSHTISVDRFLRALMRDVAWNFFYGTVNFDEVFGTTNHYGTVDVFGGLYNAGYRARNKQFVETLNGDSVRSTFAAMLEDWTNEGFDPFAAPEETGTPFGAKHGSNLAALRRNRVVAQRMVGLKGDTPLRSDANGNPVNRQFSDVDQSEPEVHAEPGFENEVHAFNFFAYLSRSDVTWNPSITSAVKNSLLCPTTEEYMLPIIHGNDRVEWFVQLSDEIHWDVQDRETGAPRARVVMKPGDVAAMPANIRHQGYSPRRSMLLVWEHNDSSLPELYANKKLKPNPVDF